MLTPLLHDRFEDARERNSHHLLYCRRAWSVGYNKKLRDHPWMKIDLPIERHNAIHQFLDCVPPPDPVRSKEVLEILDEMAKRNAINKNAGLVTRINFLLCIWNGYKDCQPTCRALRKQRQLFQHYENPL